MPWNPRVRAWPLAPSWAVALVLVTGCGGQETAPVTPGAPTTPAPGPSSDLRKAERDAEDLTKAATPPVIIQPNAPTAPAPAPVPAPAPAPAPGKAG